MGFVCVTFGFGYGMRTPPEPLRRVRGPSFPSPITFCVPAFCTAANRPISNCLLAFLEGRASVRIFAPLVYFGEEVRDVVSTLRNFSRAAYRSPSASRGRLAFFRSVSITHIPDGPIASRPARMHLKPNLGVRGSWQRAVASWGFLFHHVTAIHYSARHESLLINWTLGILVIAVPKVVEF
jgi:hypothetical protein